METAQFHHCHYRHSGNPVLQQVGHKGDQWLEAEEDILEKVESEITNLSINKIFVIIQPVR